MDPKQIVGVPVAPSSLLRPTAFERSSSGPTKKRGGASFGVMSRKFDAAQQRKQVCIYFQIKFACFSCQMMKLSLVFFTGPPGG